MLTTKMNQHERTKLISLVEQIFTSKGEFKFLAWTELQRYVKQLDKKYGE